MLRLAVGYSYDEIAAAENATLRTTERQLTRARRLLREPQARQLAAEGPAELLERPVLDIELAAAACEIPADALARAHAQDAVSG